MADNLPTGFKDLKDIDPTIQLSPDGGRDINFIGRPFKGYKNPNKVIVTEELGAALKQVQIKLKDKGLSLLVYDAYRPQMAVDDFIEWSKDLKDQKMKRYFYPYIDKAKIFELGYAAKRSSHSRGSAVDLTIIPIDAHLKEIEFQERILPSGKKIPFLDDNSIDMGSSAGLFDEVSWTDNKDISLEAQNNRKLLKEIMEEHGFKNYSKEWWHFNIKKEPFPNTYFNFEIE
jgi:D-alanyl-D-alanine dipeptidase